MLRGLHRALLWSPFAALALQLALVTVAAAAGGGADFPRR